MKNDLKNPLSFYKSPEVPAGLAEKILLKIVRRERRILGIKIAASASIFVISISTITITCRDLMFGLSHSGFFQFASLAFSDFSSVASSFPDFAYSMVESFPIFTAALLLSGILFAIWSMAAFIDETSLFRARGTLISR